MTLRLHTACLECKNIEPMLVSIDLQVPKTQLLGISLLGAELVSLRNCKDAKQIVM